MRVLKGKRTRPVTSVALTPDGRTLVAAGELGFEVPDLTVGTSTQVVVERIRRVFAVVLDPLGRFLYYSASGDGFWIYDLTSLGRKWQLADSAGYEDNHVISAAASPDGS